MLFKTTRGSAATSMAVLAVAGLAEAAPPVRFPTYKLSSATTFPESMQADIAASAFVGADGQFHFLTSAADYEQSDSGGSFVNTYTADNFGVMANGNTDHVSCNTYWNRPGTYCYQLDRRADRPMPSLYQDDHCDVIGIWVDPVSNDWVGAVNDEYQFDPWNFTDITTNQRIKSSKHNNRILHAKSSDQGQTWDLVDALVVDNYQPGQTITPELFPNTTYSWGISGVRFYVDYPTGYAYVQFNHQVRNKKGDATLIKWYNHARAPLVDGLAPDTWRKYWDGKWTEPAIGGRDAYWGEPLGFTVVYDPITDYLAYEGTSANNKQVKYQSTPLVNSTFTFSDPDGTEYTANTKTNTITTNGQTVSEVSYHDPALQRDFVIGKNFKGQISINQTDSYGATSSFVPASVTTVFKDHTLNRLYVQPTTIFQSAYSYNVQSRKYRSVGYDNHVYESDDIGNPHSWVPVGVQPESVLAHAAYTSSLDTGSLTNQFISSRTYSILSDLWVSVDTISMQDKAGPQTSFSQDAAPSDAKGKPIEPSQQYKLSVGGTDVGAGTWSFENVKDGYTGDAYTGFYRIKDTATGKYLQVSGSTAIDQRKWGAATTTGDAQPDYDPAGNGGHGSPGGSDQWYLIPFGGNTQAVLDESSSQDDINAAQKTSLKDAAGYKLANRNSGAVLVSQDGGFAIAANEFSKNTAQALKVEPVKGKRSRVLAAL